MSGRARSYSVALDVNVGRDVEIPRPADDTPFRILLLGDFRGRGDRSTEAAGALARRTPVRVDRDDLDAVIATFAPEIRIPLPGGGESCLTFGGMDDFHPDTLYDRERSFHSLRDFRRELADPSTFAAAAGRLSAGPGTPRATPKPARAMPDNILEDIIQQTPDVPSGESGEDLAGFINRIMAPYLVPNILPQQTAMLAQVDAATGTLMRSVLHHPEFQTLEALWRSVFFLVRRIDTSSALQIWLVDVTRAELERDLAAGRSADQTELHEMISHSAREAPWAAAIGLYTLGEREADCAALASIASFAQSLQVPWIVAADPRLAGCSAVTDLSSVHPWEGAPPAGWATLRQQAAARWLGLAVPRLLLRLPYGRDGEECERFAFEELTSESTHLGYLWGNPAVGCALLLAQMFEESGWRLRPGANLDIDHLPIHLWHGGGEATATPCAEVLMTEASAARLLDQGLMPFASMKGQDIARLVRFQSVADPIAALAGRWMGA